MSIPLSALAKATEAVVEGSARAGDGALKATEGGFEAGGLKSAGEALPDFANKEMSSVDGPHEGKWGELPNFHEQEAGEKSDLPDFDTENVSESDGLPDKEATDVVADGTSQIEGDASENGNLSTEGVDAGGEGLEERKQGGLYGELTKNDQWGGHLEEYPPHEVHHMPPDSVNGLERNDGPAIVMEKADHRQTASCGNSLEAREYRAKQKEAIDQGKFKEAMQMDIDDIHEKFGDKYDIAIAQMQEAAKDKGLI